MESGQKLQCSVAWETDGKDLFILNIDFAQLINVNFNSTDSRSYSPNLKDVAGLEDARLISILIHLSIYFLP